MTMKRNIHQTSAALLVLLASACQSGLPTELIVDDTPPVIPGSHVPPLAGGTLLVTSDGGTAVVSDPERDRLLVVDLSSDSVSEIQLEPRDEPGRLVEGPAGTVFVALRGGGAVVAVDLSNATIALRSDVCEAPRGMLYDDASLHLACASGALVTLDATTLIETRRARLGPDLRDVVKRDGQLFVTHFRSAELTRLDADGVAELTITPDPVLIAAAPHVAWRTAVSPDGLLLMLHQRQLNTEIQLDEVGGGTASYAGLDCGLDELVRAEITLFDDELQTSHIVGPHFIGGMHLAIDFAISPDGTRAAVVDPAGRRAREIDLTSLETSVDCDPGDEALLLADVAGTPVAVAYAGDDIIVQTREPASLVVFHERSHNRTIPLGGVPRADTGFDLFHNTSDMPNSIGLACASCHPEGRDDGHVWSFSGEGLRRTQSLAGTLAGTAPCHWGGNLPTLRSLMAEVSARRMGGVEQSPARVAALESWLLSLTPVRLAPDPLVDQSVVDQGEALFNDETVGCASCHSGPSFTNNANENVGRGGALQVPSLIGIGMRAPFMHDGCADTLMDRFAPECGGDQHGDIEGLDAADLEALVAYMNTL
jgi:mono/diheme cytochrome c family protein